MSSSPLRPPPATVWRPERAAEVFRTRAQRASALAGSRQPSAYLHFLAHLSQTQESILSWFEPAGAVVQRVGSDADAPPLASLSLPKNWTEALRDLLKGLVVYPLPAAAKMAVERTQAATPAQLELTAERLLQGDFNAVEADAGLLVGATLQVCWTQLAAALKGSFSVDPGKSAQCPVCDAAPACSRVSAGPESGGRRLYCGLCATAWHVPRIRCVACGSGGESVSYLGDAQLGPAVKAEVCETCKSYLKIFYEERDPLLEPLIDDIASLSLDLAMDAAGYRRIGPNWLLLPGRA